MGQPHPPEAHASPANVGESEWESEWEYEYDENASEHLYFTLDLTTHVPDALAQRHDAAPPHPRPRPKLQILDLHSRSPLVRLDDTIYTCYWSTDLGTQFHLSHAGMTAHPRRPGTVLDVVALSQTRLIGRPVTLTQKNVTASQPGAPSEKAAVTINETDKDDDHPEEEEEEEDPLSAPALSNDPSQPLVIPRELCKNATAEAQASFLEKLSQIKLQRGEHDRIPIYSIRIHADPANKAELKRRAVEADAARIQDVEMTVDGPPRKRRKRLTAVEKGLSPDGAQHAAGRKGRRELGARVGFQGRGPGALAPVRSVRQKAVVEEEDDEAEAEAEAVAGEDEDEDVFVDAEEAPSTSAVPAVAEQEDHVQAEEPG